MPEMPVRQKVPILSSIVRLLKLSGKERIWFIVSLLSKLLENGVILIWNIIMIYLIDSVVAQNKAEFLKYLYIVIVFCAAMIPMSLFSSYSLGLFSERVVKVFRKKLAAHMSALPVRYLEQKHTGDMLGILNSDIIKMQTAVTISLVSIIMEPLMTLAVLVTLAIMNWQLTIAVVLLVPFMMVFMTKINKPIALRAREVQQATGETAAVAQDGLGGLMVTKVFNLFKTLGDRFGKKNKVVLEKGKSQWRYMSVMFASGNFFSFLPYFITFGYGGYLAIKGHMSFGTLFIFINMLQGLVNPLWSIPQLTARISEGCGAAQRMFQVLDQAEERPGGKRFDAEEGNAVISFRRADFSYEKEQVLKDISFDILKGQTIALVGPSGGGKSTLLKLLLGFYPAENNRVFLYDHDLNEWELDSARRQMSFVAQDTYLFPVSISENIGFGRPDAGKEDIERAAKMANIHDFIISLPEGYDTVAGERGARLSGGERQRISLARAVLKNSPILLLDEPTSALDTESEALVQEALERFMAGRTTIVIAHRLSTIRSADRVLVLDGGRIIEDGTHDELLARNGRYKDLYMRQFNGSGTLKEEAE